MIRGRVPGVRQRDATDCGAACLLSVARYHGRRVPLSRIRQFADTDRNGTSVFGMLEAATRLGFTAKGVRGKPESLPSIPLPAIAHVTGRDGMSHFVVIARVSRARLTVMDPRDGVLARIPTDEFIRRWTGVLILLAPEERLAHEPRARSTVGRFWSLVRPHRSVLPQALAGAVLHTLLGLSTAIYVQKIVDHVLVDGNRGLLNTLGVAMVVILVAQTYIGTAQSLLVLRTGQRMDVALVLGYHRHLLRLPQRFFDTMRIGEIISRVGDAVKIRALINDTALDIVVNVLVVAFSFALMTMYDRGLALVMTTVIPVYALVLWVANRVNRRQLRLLMEHGADLESSLVESVNAISTIRRFDIAEDTERGMEARFVRVLRAVRGATTASIVSMRGTEFASRLAIIVLFWVGSGFVIGGGLTPGELMSFYALVGYLTGPVTQLVGANRSIQDALIAADRLFEILDLEAEVEHRGVEVARIRSDLEGSERAPADVVLENVRFRYGAHRRIFDGLDLRIPEGSYTAFVGESGSGKSTLISVLQKLYPIESGTVKIGRTDLREIDTVSLRRWVAAVPQVTHLFARSVIENIALGDPAPDMARVLELCDALEITPFVRALPLGFHTILGENGAELSGGQRQRLSIARALYREPRLLLLDEATSHLDSRGEAVVRRRISALRETGATVVAVAHRLSTVVGADRILVFDGGRVTEEGKHDELIRGDGLYAELWRQQTECARATSVA